MTDRDKHDKPPRKSGQRSNDPQRPSQAEGERGSVEEALGEHARGQSGTAGGQANDPKRPSQAEGERGMNTKDLRDRSHRGPS